MPRRTVKDGKITLKDGAGTPKTLELAFDGELSWSGGDYEKVRIRDRGALGEVRDGDAKPVSLSFKCKYLSILGDTGGGESVTPYEFLTKTGGCAGYASTGPTGEAHAANVEFEIANPDGSGKKETITFTEFRLHEYSFSESMDGDEESFSGEAESVASARAAQS